MIILGLGAGHGQEDARRDELRFVGAQDLAQHGLPVRGAVDEIGGPPRTSPRRAAGARQRRVQVEGARRGRDADTRPKPAWSSRCRTPAPAPCAARPRRTRRPRRARPRPLLADVGRRPRPRGRPAQRPRRAPRQGRRRRPPRRRREAGPPARGPRRRRRSAARRLPSLAPSARVPLVVRLARRPVVLAPAQGHDGPAVGAPDAAVVDRRRAAGVRRPCSALSRRRALASPTSSKRCSLRQQRCGRRPRALPARRSRPRCGASTLFLAAQMRRAKNGCGYSP